MGQFSIDGVGQFYIGGDTLERGVRFGHLAVDGGYGKDPAFLRAVDALNCCFVADVHSNQRLYLQDPHPQLPVRKGHGKLPLGFRRKQRPSG